MHYDSEDTGCGISCAVNLAIRHNWEHELSDDDQVVMAIEGHWKTYSLVIRQVEADNTLRFLCVYRISSEKINDGIYDLLNRINDLLWIGSIVFTYCGDESSIFWRYALQLGPEPAVNEEQVETIINQAIETMDKFYPTLMSLLAGDTDPERAIALATPASIGRA